MRATAWLPAPCCSLSARPAAREKRGGGASGSRRGASTSPSWDRRACSFATPSSSSALTRPTLGGGCWRQQTTGNRDVAAVTRRQAPSAGRPRNVRAPLEDAAVHVDLLEHAFDAPLC